MGMVLSLIGFLWTAGIPTIIGYFIMRFFYQDSDGYQLLLAMMFLFIFNLAVASNFVNLISISLDCMFVFYSISKQITHGVNDQFLQLKLDNDGRVQFSPQYEPNMENLAQTD